MCPRNQLVSRPELHNQSISLYSDIVLQQEHVTNIYLSGFTDITFYVSLLTVTRLQPKAQDQALYNKCLLTFYTFTLICCLQTGVNVCECRFSLP